MSECRLGRLAWRSRTPSMRDAQTLPGGPSRPISVVRRPRGTRAHDCTEQCEEIGAAGIFVRWGVGGRRAEHGRLLVPRHVCSPVRRD